MSRFSISAYIRDRNAWNECFNDPFWKLFRIELRQDERVRHREASRTFFVKTFLLMSETRLLSKVPEFSDPCSHPFAAPDGQEPKPSGLCDVRDQRSENSSSRPGEHASYNDAHWFSVGPYCSSSSNNNVKIPCDAPSPARPNNNKFAGRWERRGNAF